MKSTLLVVVAFASILANTAWAEEDGKVPAFAESIRKLNREPPTSPSQTRATILTQWIDQKVDHFDASETRTYKMRYMVNDEHFKSGGPIFIYVGGEWEISPGSIQGGHFYDMAREHKGILYYTEHRYYGQSRPTSDLSVGNLKYLHVKQALADLAHFIKTQRETVPGLKNSKVIMAGGSYAATMVVWFKRLYPELLDGGWASSAPILAKVDFIEYKEVVGRAMRELGSNQCYDRIQNGISGLETMFAQKRGAEVKAMLQLCNNFDENNDLDLWSLFGTISNIFSGIVQYQHEGDVPGHCNYLNSFDDDVTAIANFVLKAFNPGPYCIDVTYKSSLNYYIQTSYAGGAGRPWYYQTCNEYGWYQTSGSRNQPFGTKFPVTLYTQLCSDTFGHNSYSNENINFKARQTNIDFGGMDPKVENVYMTHGALDPWNPMGHNEAQGATVIPRASHCADFGSISAGDSAEMRASKERIASLVRQWLSNKKESSDDGADNIEKDGNKKRRFMRQLLH